LQGKELFQVYPNPAHRMVRIIGPDSYEAELLDLTGRSLGLFKPEYGKVNINITSLYNGVYMVLLRHKEQQFIRRIVVRN
ncbi:MAG: T9SS type A sorting domain-containing protein, partial [Cyclobacteriaceae bacterium]|nr:T9SS type A sorting domain-containing protein [Cyclobacteriaceae bacterium]